MKSTLKVVFHGNTFFTNERKKAVKTKWRNKSTGLWIPWKRYTSFIWFRLVTERASFLAAVQSAATLSARQLAHSHAKHYTRTYVHTCVRTLLLYTYMYTSTSTTHPRVYFIRQRPIKRGNALLEYVRYYVRIFSTVNASVFIFFVPIAELRRAGIHRRLRSDFIFKPCNMYFVDSYVFSGKSGSVESW